MSEVRKRLLDSGTPPALWFWRTANGDEVDLVVEAGPERFLAIECKVSERINASDAKGLRKLVEEYGPKSVTGRLIVCRTATSYPVEPDNGARAVSVADAIKAAL